MSNISLFDCLKQHFLHLPGAQNAKKSHRLSFALYISITKNAFSFSHTAGSVMKSMPLDRLLSPLW